MRISDWSSDVCSSDLVIATSRSSAYPSDLSSADTMPASRRYAAKSMSAYVRSKAGRRAAEAGQCSDTPRDPRSDERRVGKGVSVRVDLGGRRIFKKKTQIN